jgi:hypothetical protein
LVLLTGLTMTSIQTVSTLLLTKLMETGLGFLALSINFDARHVRQGGNATNPTLALTGGGFLLDTP